MSWDEALDEITERLAKILKENPNKLTFGGSPPVLGHIWWMIAGLFRTAFGSINAFHTPGAAMCGQASHLLSGTNHCSWSTAPDFQYCNYAVYFGSGKGVGTGHSMAMMARSRADALARGLKTVSFDPICHQSGGLATEWVPILPGGDLAVCLSMANYLVNEVGIYDAEYLRDKTNSSYLIKEDGRYVRDEKGEPLIWDLAGKKAKPWHEAIGEAALEGNYEANGVKCQPVFALLKEHLKQYTPEWASKITTVPANTIRRIAKEMGENAKIGSSIEIQGTKLPYRPVAVAQFRGGQAHTTGYHTYMAGDLLLQLLGACEVPGGQIGWVAKSEGHPETGLPRFGPVAKKDGFTGGSNWPLGFHGTWPHSAVEEPKSTCMNEIFPTSGAGIHYLPNNEEWMRKLGLDYDTEFLLCMGGNFAQTAMELGAITDYLKKRFIVIADIYNTETTEGFADIVLPDASWLESYDIANSWLGFIFNHPVGMLRQEFAIRQPVVEPLYERRYFIEVSLELCDRLGIRENWNKAVNTIFERDGVPKDKFIPLDSNLSYQEFMDWLLKAYYGPKHGLDYFKEHGHINWPKKVEEAYWRHYTNARAMIYSEYLIDQAEKAKAIAEPRGIEVEWEQYTPFPTYFPNALEKAKAKDSSYDLFSFSFKDMLHTSSMSHGIPWLDEMSEHSPYHYFVLMNTKMAKKKGIKDGDIIVIENDKGYKSKGQVHTIEGIHPQALGFLVGAGGWARDRPESKRLGSHYNNLLYHDLNHVCPITLNAEGGAAVKVYKEVVK
ncbi:molybdopterin-dependent oxidoreductase [bacterium]|nr:molybdopterin-dependent oxidoreductase [bacterium]